MDKDLIKMRDLFREIADIMDEMLELEVRETNGEDVKKELEGAAGRLMIKMMVMQSITDKM